MITYSINFERLIFLMPWSSRADGILGAETDRAVSIHPSLPSRKMRLRHEGEPGWIRETQNLKAIKCRRKNKSAGPSCCQCRPFSITYLLVFSSSHRFKTIQVLHGSNHSTTARSFAAGPSSQIQGKAEVHWQSCLGSWELKPRGSSGQDCDPFFRSLFRSLRHPSCLMPDCEEC